jgi:hypothetical protein
LGGKFWNNGQWQVRVEDEDSCMISRWPIPV